MRRAGLPMSDLEMITNRSAAGEYAWACGSMVPVVRLRSPVGVHAHLRELAGSL